MESEAELLWPKKKSLKCETEVIISQCSVPAKSGCKSVRYVNEKVPQRFQDLAPIVETKLNIWTTWETAKLQHFPTDALFKWTDRQDGEVGLETTRPDGTDLASFPVV